ncbi:hypothetical protein LJR098_003360 [Rhizobium sp. LjRoot98]|uniref:hypothetical protein n=1 Tax=Rhizobium sp. LjRoot98 TaxID=3342345 RepID=UPI003ECEAB2D
MSISASSGRVASTVPTHIFYPLHTVRCSGPGIFRSQLSRDIACILDVDEAVVSWSCLAVVLTHEDQIYRPDFLVERADGLVLVDGRDAEDKPSWVGQNAQDAGYRYETMEPSALSAIRLKNAKDLLRYARYEVPLSDRVRLLAALDEHGTLSVADALAAFAETKPIAGIASLFLQRLISMDLDEGLIGPETIISRKRD